MTSTPRPSRRPARPFFSSGPCAKRPGWEPSVLANAPVGRSHRAGPGAARIREVIEASDHLYDFGAHEHFGRFSRWSPKWHADELDTIWHHQIFWGENFVYPPR